MALAKTFGTALRKAGQSLERLGLGLQGSFAYKETLSKHRTLQAFEGATPKLGTDIFVAPNASVIGNVTLGDNSSVWYNTVLRGDVNNITVGTNTNIQDAAIVHVARHALGDPTATVIGNNVTIGHGAVIHACTIEDDCLIGMGATVLDGSQVKKGSIVAAGALVTPGTVVPTGEIWAGRPAKKLRDLDPEEATFVTRSAANYAMLAKEHAVENAKTLPEIELDRSRRRDRMLRDPDHDSHLGIRRDPETREIISKSQGT
mmetsp:Transcript_21324/g.64154  ORF Transcript_21324/g.64154 Transcript_21324/m.64154 type:complete len:260 (-) Transcript_21324:242-1021(-)|eukprot:CAMPEP_0206134512 /NCGR_PEP_ID=MMETSP1473-20131121/53_1 /ASSEMBLY_ACC=CAM_ASM_001109 /TAXON_ID=1461547 /ORGANISM="Stichococcus sp, Strain RCC1054" /LENGTH=259 /DNA_ID=CAMNT_0053526127 /DNA_START=175 /DNA_END=954 /DNA_ORIENTATION=+